MSRRAFTPEQEKEVLSLYADGMGLKSLAAQYGVSIQPIRSCLKRHRVISHVGRPAWRSFHDDEVNQMVELWNAGQSASRIAHEFGTTRGIVVNVLGSRGSQVEHRPNRPRGAQHGSWKGGRTLTEGGYIRVLVDPADPLRAMADSQGYVAEHRLVMARHLGRLLTERETVHHKDTNPGNNALSNLQLRQGNHGKGGVNVCLDCGSRNVGHLDL